MQVTTPKEMRSGLYTLDEILKKFEYQFAEEDQDKSFYHLVIVGEYPREL